MPNGSRVLYAGWCALLILGGCRSAEAQAPVPPGFDFSGIDRFWPVYEALTHDREPAPSAWDALFATPGYAALESREHRRGALEQAMRLALRPQLLAARDSVLTTETFLSRSTRHLMNVSAARDSMARFRTALERSGVVPAARHAVASFLPPEVSDSVAPPPIAAILFLDDGRGYPELIVVDLLNLTRSGLDTGFFAHELYHFYRRHLPPPTADVNPRYEGIDELIGYPAEEGVADQLDKRRYVEASDSAFAAMMRMPGAPTYAPTYRAAYRGAGHWMAIVSAGLERASQFPDSANAIGRALRDTLPDAGRALGAFMARAIDSILGRQGLVGTGRDEVAFWLEYDEAARRGSPSLPRLSPGALALIRRIRLEKN